MPFKLRLHVKSPCFKTDFLNITLNILAVTGFSLTTRRLSKLSLSFLETTLPLTFSMVTGVGLLFCEGIYLMYLALLIFAVFFVKSAEDSNSLSYSLSPTLAPIYEISVSLGSTRREKTE